MKPKEAQPLKRKKKLEEVKVSREEFLDIRPVRNPKLKWDSNEAGEVEIFVPYKKVGRLRSLFSKFYRIPREKKIELDKIGAQVWKMCDGNHSVKEILGVLREEHKLVREEAEVALQTYLNQLIKRGLIGFIIPEETRARSEEELESTEKTLKIEKN